MQNISAVNSRLIVCPICPKLMPVQFFISDRQRDWWSLDIAAEHPFHHDIIVPKSIIHRIPSGRGGHRHRCHPTASHSWIESTQIRAQSETNRAIEIQLAPPNLNQWADSTRFNANQCKYFAVVLCRRVHHHLAGHRAK